MLQCLSSLTVSPYRPCRKMDCTNYSVSMIPGLAETAGPMAEDICLYDNHMENGRKIKVRINSTCSGCFAKIENHINFLSNVERNKNSKAKLLFSLSFSIGFQVIKH